MRESLINNNPIRSFTMKQFASQFVLVASALFAVTAFGAEPAKKPEAAKPAASAPAKKPDVTTKQDAQNVPGAVPAKPAAPAPAPAKPVAEKK
jgi:hypothetical protein